MPAAGHRDTRRDAQHRAAPLLGETGQLAPLADGDDTRTQRRGLRRGLDRLLRVAGERDREDEGPLPDEARQLVVLRHEDGHG